MIKFAIYVSWYLLPARSLIATLFNTSLLFSILVHSLAVSFHSRYLCSPRSWFSASISTCTCYFSILILFQHKLLNFELLKTEIWWIMRFNQKSFWFKEKLVIISLSTKTYWGKTSENKSYTSQKLWIFRILLYLMMYSLFTHQNHVLGSHISELSHARKLSIAFPDFQRSKQILHKWVTIIMIVNS